jgi:cell division protein FtsW
LPESTNDSIFAIIAEEFGFAGAGVVVVLFATLVWRGIQISRRAADDYGRYVAIGISCWIGFQAAINIAAMLNLIPLTGITLPFISYGGTSLVALLVGVGILQNISKFTYKEVYDENTGRGRGNRRAYFAGSGRRRSLNA